MNPKLKGRILNLFARTGIYNSLTVNSTELLYQLMFFRFICYKLKLIDVITIPTSLSGGMTVLYLCAQLAVLYTFNSLLILIYYRLGQNLHIINEYAVRSRYS